MGRKISKAIGIILLFFLIGCHDPNALIPVENYIDGIISDKEFVPSSASYGNLYDPEYYLTIKHYVPDNMKYNKWKHSKIRVVKYDYDKYNIGDTIK